MNMQQGIMGSHATPDLWISAEKNPRSAELRRTFCDVEFAHFSSRIPRENHTKFRRDLAFSRSQVHNFCSGVPPKNKKTKSVKKKVQPIRGHGISILSQFSAVSFFSRSQTPPCPIIGRNGKKVHKVRRDLFGKLI